MNAKGVDTIEKLAIMMADGFSELREEMDTRFDAVDARFDKVDEQLAAIRAELSEIKADLAELKEKTKMHDGYAKDIDHLHTRIVRIEQHLNITKA